VLFSVVIFSLSNSVMGGQLDDILNKRISDFSHDNGSGRFTLWEAAFKYYLSNPYIGIGAFNFSNYHGKNQKFVYLICHLIGPPL
ncbi:O-antigen ligase family protein, partial [Bacillus thuringiensis]|nr:O-antigen ligase family protein [Bacillus thuringiensis]